MISTKGRYSIRILLDLAEHRGVGYTPIKDVAARQSISLKYVEKLMPVISFLRERLGFNDGIIRRLCEFKEVGIKGELYSSEFNRSFDTRHSVCSIKQDESGKFDFKIDGVSHVNWFRKKMNEFRETIGIPKQRQDRGIKL